MDQTTATTPLEPPSDVLASLWRLFCDRIGGEFAGPPPRPEDFVSCTERCLRQAR